MKIIKKAYVLTIAVMLIVGCGSKQTQSDLPNQTTNLVNDTINRSYAQDAILDYPLSKLGFDKTDTKNIIPARIKGSLPDFALNQWLPKQMDYSGKLVKKWEVEASIDVKYTPSMQSIPEGWAVGESNLAISNKIIDPYNGNIIRELKMDRYDWDVVSASDYWFHASSGEPIPYFKCTNYRNWTTTWVSSLSAMASDQHITIIKGCLINAYYGPACMIQRFNPQTGEVIWELQAKSWINAEDSIYFRTQSTYDKNNLYIVNEYYHPGHKAFRLVMYRINPKDGSYTMKDLYYYKLDQNPITIFQPIHYYQGYIWIITGDGILIKVDSTTMEISAKYNVGQIDADDIYLSGQYILIDNKNYDKIMVNVDKRTVTKINWKWNIVDSHSWVRFPKYSGQFIRYDNDKIYHILDDKMDKDWYIDTNDLAPFDINKTYVLMQDSRGVLVKTDNKIICFGKP